MQNFKWHELKNTKTNDQNLWTDEILQHATAISPMIISNDINYEEHLDAGKVKFIEPDNFSLSESATPIPNTQVWPFTAIGKVFGQWIDQNNGKHTYQGSGWLVGGSGNRLVITAGHSLFDYHGILWPAKTWLHNYAFVGVDNSIMPIVKVAVHTGWAVDGKFQYDIGAAVLAKGLINSGNLGIAFNIPPKQSGPWNNVGYPNGGPMAQATGNYAGGGGEGRQIAMTNNDLTSGASGGPWFTNFQGNPWYVNGLLSTRGGGTPYEENMPLSGSPYFGQGVYDFIKWCQQNML